MTSFGEWPDRSLSAACRVFGGDRRFLRIRLKKFRPQSAVSVGYTKRENRKRDFFPETTGPDCAFLDYDNDGLMDIYPVNRGKCDGDLDLFLATAIPTTSSKAYTAR